MPHKIGFTVISWSGHEGNYSAKKLMVHAPTVIGWRSTRFCPFPQEIILQLVERCCIRKLQLLAHQYLIPSKIEFHIGDRLPESSSPQQTHNLHRLGYVSLSDNEKTGFRARELKSVHVDAVGSYLKLTFHRNHVNQYNSYNQVALVALNILGDPVDGNEIGTALSKDQLIDQYLNNSLYSSALDGTYTGLSSYKCDSISPLDDLAFDMYQDPEVAHIIRLLDQKKQDMVREERFELAKKLKQAIADLQKVGERLGRYDVEKHSAIEREDYDTAKQKKEQLEAYRLTVYQQLELHDLLDISQIHRISEVSNSEFPSPRVGTQKHAPHPADSPRKRRQRQHVKETDEQDTSKAASPKYTVAPTPLTPPHFPKIDISSLPYDERPLPALRKRSSDQPVSELDEMPPLTDTATPCSPGAAGKPEPLTEKAQREASLPIDICGDSLVAGAYSKIWSYREDALLTVYKKLLEVPPGTPKAELRSMTRAAVFLCKKALTDKVSSVFLASLNLLRMILSEFIPNHQLGKSEISHCVEQTWNNLLSRTGESTLRLRTLAITFIQEMALFKEVRALQMVPVELVRPMQSSALTRLALSRLELLEKLLEQLGTKDSGFTLDNVMRFLAGGLEHSAASVRELSVRVVQAMYRLHGKAVLNYLPSDDTSTRKNVLYKNLFDSLAMLDGNTINTQKAQKGAEKGDGEKEKEEIRSLQEQLAVLKEISEKGKENTKVPEKKAEKATKSGVKKVNQSVPADVKGSEPSVANFLDNLCIFCGERDESFTEDGLDLHYWKHCLMLQRCLQCRQVVEIASLTEHLLTECERRADFTQCPLCSEALTRDKLTEHAQSAACNPPASGENCNHCPLCHENFTSGEEGWKSHLMGIEGCKQNSRRRAVQQSTLTHAQGKTVSTAIAKTTTVIPESKTRGLGRGSRIPAPASRINRRTRIPPGKASTHRLQQA
ncbi:centrosomal protein of 104 kDa-like isoform X2 [Sinocyclocheilus anshuiensis]|uniref:centrosomal protein of 104 kDa-like isoform X2 n=1 Tax=Sinocyclocheilus anshuiensis TaxID=1608454 RepID=UPI0007B90626|nr:PREDICTED: centrosomal protein of 104 kDa-like isoform X2 [Sinocyclocheilus anshuiensis]